MRQFIARVTLFHQRSCNSRKSQVSSPPVVLICNWDPPTLPSLVAWISRIFAWARTLAAWRSEEHTSELQSQSNLVCRLLLEKKKNSSELRMSPNGITTTHTNQTR